MAAPVVVVGAGLAGTSVVREIRKLDPGIRVVVVTADAAEIYAKPNLSNALASGKEPARLVQFSGEDWAARNRVELRSRTRVLGVDRPGKMLRTDQGEIPYGSLVLALGAQPVRPPWEGDGLDRVRSVNSLRDYEVFRGDLVGARSVAVIGGGLVGCEFADDMRSTGLQVAVFDPGSHPLGRLLPEQTGNWVRERMEQAGMVFHAGTGVVSVYREGNGLRLVDSRGESHLVDAVLSAVGLRPEVELAKEMGLTVQRGISVDRHLRTSDPDIYALGDCAEVESLVLPFVQPILHASRALAATLTGNPTVLRYPAMPVVVKTPSVPTVVCPPPPGAHGRWREDVAAEGVVSVFLDENDQALGFVLAGETVKERTRWAERMPDWL
ncbi:MAG: FAD-dependent oxidoreductase [Fibrobacteria bacterium]|nr:FAD-dependent oxidoreductase [Fibrobacteria bacterium]